MYCAQKSRFRKFFADTTNPPQKKPDVDLSFFTSPPQLSGLTHDLPDLIISHLFGKVPAACFGFALHQSRPTTRGTLGC